MHREISAGVIVYYSREDSLKYLTLHYEAGHWDFPKGHAEGDEELQEAAVRETKEETNLDVNLKHDFKERLSYMYRNKEGVLMNKTVYFFLGESKTKEVTLSGEHIGCEWLSYDDALERLTYDNARSILKKAHKHLTQKTLKDY